MMSKDMFQVISSVISAIATLGAALINAVIPSFLKKDEQKDKQITQDNTSTPRQLESSRNQAVIGGCHALGWLLVLDIAMTVFFRYPLINLQLWIKVVATVALFRLPAYIKRQRV